MNDLATFLRARLDETEAALIRYRDGHEGPCVNFEGQDPKYHDPWDSCDRHIKAAEATPYRDARFGLADIEAKRHIVELYADADRRANLAPSWDARTLARAQRSTLEVVLRLQAAAWIDHPDYREEWRPY